MSNHDNTSPADLLTAVTKLMAAYDRIERDDLPDGFAALMDDVYATGTRVTGCEELRRRHGALCLMPQSVLWTIEALLADAEDAAADALVCAIDDEDKAHWQERLDEIGDSINTIKAAYLTTE